LYRVETISLLVIGLYPQHSTMYIPVFVINMLLGFYLRQESSYCHIPGVVC